MKKKTKKAAAKKPAVKAQKAKAAKKAPAKKPAKKPVKKPAAKPVKKPAAKPVPKKAAAATESDLLKRILVSLDDDKAVNIVTINLEGRSALCDAAVIASGRSSRHVVAMDVSPPWHGDHMATRLSP